MRGFVLGRENALFEATLAGGKQKRPRAGPLRAQQSELRKHYNVFEDSSRRRDELRQPGLPFEGAGGPGVVLLDIGELRVAACERGLRVGANVVQRLDGGAREIFGERSRVGVV